MGMLEDRHTHTHQGHRIEVVENAVTKRVALLVDGREVASESCMLPQEITLHAAIDAAPVQAKIVIRFLRGSIVTLEIDGVPTPLTKHE